MNAIDLLQNFQAIGARFELSAGGVNISAPRGTVTTEMRDLLKAYKGEVVSLLRQSQVEDAELQWRIEAMRPQLPEPGKPFPTLSARPESSPRLGDCFSCGESLKESESGYSCGLCSRAKHILLGL
jgi:hypothetical protein